MDLSLRIDRPEIMDTEQVSECDMRKTLSFLQLTNNNFGGAKLILNHLKQWSSSWKHGEAISILDIGTGGAEIPIAISKWGKQNGFKIKITAIDLVSEIIAIAKKNTAGYPDITVRQEDLFVLARNNQKFDYVIASLLLHHIPPAESINALHAFDKLSKRGVIVSDLLRSRASYWAVTTLSYLCGNHIVRHDGPLSVRRAFRLDELDAMAQEAHLPYLKARHEAWFRVSLAGEK